MKDLLLRNRTRLLTAALLVAGHLGPPPSPTFLGACVATYQLLAGLLVGVYLSLAYPEQVETFRCALLHGDEPGQGRR